MPDPGNSRFARVAREVRTAGLALLGGLGAFTYSYEASFSAPVAALLLVSAVGAAQLLLRSVEDELVHYTAHDLSVRYGYESLVYMVPPFVFFMTTYFHLVIHVTAEELIFVGAGLITTIPAAGLVMRAIRMRRVAKAETPG